jgi:DNA-binding response OmpR family regulator
MNDPSIIDSVSLLIHMMWPECEIVSSGLGGEGLDLIGKELPDAVILDLELPDISGFDVLKHYKTFSPCPPFLYHSKSLLSRM